MIKRGICYSVLLSLTLPLTLLWAEKVKTFDATALKSLDAITREKEEAPALLSVTPLSTSKNNPVAVFQQKPPTEVVQSKHTLENKQRARLKSQIQRLNEKVIQQRVELKKLRMANRGNSSEVLNSHSSTKITIKKTQSEETELAKKLEKSQQTISQLQQFLKEKEQHNNKLEQQLTELNKKTLQGTQKTERQQVEKKALMPEIKENKQQAQAVKQLQLTLQEKQKNNTELQQKLMTRTEEHDKTLQQLKQLQKSLQAHQQASLISQQRVAEITKENTQKTQQLQFELQKEQHTKKMLQEQLLVKTQQYEQTASQLKELQPLINATKEANNKLQKQLAAQSDESKKNASVLSDKQRAIAGLQEKLKTQQQENDNNVQEIAKLHNMLAKVQSASKAATLVPTAEKEKQDKGGSAITIHSQAVSTGSLDVVDNKIKTPEAQLKKDLQKEHIDNIKQLKLENEKEGTEYINQFKKKKGVVHSAKGFYYHINNKGTGSSTIKSQDVVTVAVKESLVNGKVIKDMISADTSFFQPLGSYPPLFREVLAKLKNHGSVTLVIPPKLAYGDQGLPPDIPPAATMIYHVSVLDVKKVTHKK